MTPSEKDMQPHWDAVRDRALAFQRMLNAGISPRLDAIGTEMLIQFVATVRAEGMADGHVAGVAEERARVVAWLRQQVANVSRPSMPLPYDDTLHDAANAIESAAHTEEPR